MKRKIRKMIVAAMTACVIMVPTVASAYSSEPTYGWDKGSLMGSVYGWASYDHHTCHVTIKCGITSASAGGWCYAETQLIGRNGWIPIVSADFD